MKKNIFVFLLFLFFLPLTTKAATSLTASTQIPVVGSSVFIQLNIDYGESISIREAHYRINYDTSYLNLEEIYWTQSSGTYSLEPGTIYLDKDSSSSSWSYGGQVVMKFNVIASGKTRLDINETAPALYNDGNPVSQTMSGITINAVEPKSDTTLKSLYIEGYDLSPTFNKMQYSYKVNVPSYVNEVNITAIKGDERQTIKGDGLKKLSYGDNRIQVMVNAEDGSVSTYEIMITRKDDRTGDTSLKSISISNTSITLNEKEDTYFATVSKSVSNIIITATANDPNATVIGTGTKELQIGQNVFELRVVSRDGNEKTYKILITRSTREINEQIQSTKLITLTIDRVVLDLTGNKNTFLFGIENIQQNVDIKAIAESKTAKIEITGNETLKTGINKIEIKVKEINEEEYIYTILVYKKPSSVLNINNFNEIIENKKNLMFTSLESNLHKVTKDQLKMLYENQNILLYNVTNIYGGLLYQIKMNDIKEEVDLSIKRINTNPFTYEIHLPEKQDITLYIGDSYKDSIVKIYTYKEKENYRLLTDAAKIENGYIRFTTNGDTYFTITQNPLIKKENSFTSFLSPSKIILSISFLLIIILVIKYKNKRNKLEEKEPLY